MAFTNPFAKAPSSVTTTEKPPAGADVSEDSIKDFLSQEDDDTKGEEVPTKKGKKETEEEDEEEVKVLESTGDDEEDEDDRDDEEDDEDKDDIKLKEDAEDADEDEEKKSSEEDETKAQIPPRKKDILAKYPKFFEEFPFFDKMMFRDKAYTEMFGSFDEAKEVHAKVDQLNAFEAQLFDGNPVEIFKSLKEANPKAFDKITDDYLKILGDVDPEAYKDVTENYAKRIILGMVEHAKKKDNKALHDAAKELHEFLFDSVDWTPIKVRVKEEKSEEVDEVKRERAELHRERFESARDVLVTKVDNVLKATIDSYIDPRGSMTAYEKKNAVAEALKRLHLKIGRDVNYKKTLDRLWKFAGDNKFNTSSMDGIKKSYLGFAKGLIGTVVKEVRGEVLKDNKRVSSKKSNEEEETTPASRKNVNAGRPHQQKPKGQREYKSGDDIQEFFAQD